MLKAATLAEHRRMIQEGARLNDPSDARPLSPKSRPRLEQFPLRSREVIRFSDQDAQGHVNNAVFATFFESGRVATLGDARLALRQPGSNTVLAHIAIDYFAELHWPGMVEIGTRLARIGRTSITFHQGLFTGDTCVAEARSVVVLIDAKTRRPLPLPAELVRTCETAGLSGTKPSASDPRVG